ncbi:MAG TPA: hypothetical protein VFT29_16285 [Gemmatimonadaceae bacterium]|nr:hypothetical protein [Gemmatimonadaceae bacterium]
MSGTSRVQAIRAYLSAAVLAGATLVFASVANLHPVYGILAASVVTGAMLWLLRGAFSRRRVMLWLEERAPEMRYSLAAIVESPDTPFRESLEQRVRVARFGRALALAGLKLVGGPLALLLVMQLVVRPIIARTTSSDSVSGPGKGDTRRPGITDSRFAAIVTTPGYARMAPDTIENPVSVGALVGSDVAFVGRWTGRVTMPPRPTVLRLRGEESERLVALEPRIDSLPNVVLDLPARDTVLVVARGTLPLSASARDDIGVASGWFEFIISSGSGESFKFRSGVLGRALGNGTRLQLQTTLRLDSMNLEPGDVVHLRAVARDGNPATNESGSSETRTLRVYRAGEADSVAIEGAPAPEVGKSELSQRMLIMLTEKLAAQTRKLSHSAVLDESGSIGRDQAKLRKRVGQIIFTRLTGEEATAADSEVFADTLSPTEALLRAADAATGAGAGEELEEGEDSPVVAVNRPLLEAFNEMWEAERRLGVGEPREALPHMRSALAAIQRARAAERLYLRGRPPKVVLDIARIRLSGKKEGIDPGRRSPRASDVAAALTRQARFRAALALLTGETDSGAPQRGPAAAAAVDSLTLLRIDALADQPAFAAALSAALEDLRAGRDATASLRAARGALVGTPDRGRHPRWSGAW